MIYTPNLIMNPKDGNKWFDITYEEHDATKRVDVAVKCCFDFEIWV